jgi:hypothetical protein
MLKFPIYYDNQATTAADPRVVEAMLPYFTERFGNAASRNHKYGWEAEEAVERGRAQIAALIGANAKEIIFTSGATESNNLAIKGAAHMYRDKGDHIITTMTEHKAVIDSCKRLEKEGFRVTYMAVRKDGLKAFDRIALVVIRSGRQVQQLLTPLNDLQRAILDLLGYPSDLYERLVDNSRDALKRPPGALQADQEEPERRQRGRQAQQRAGPLETKRPQRRLSQQPSQGDRQHRQAALKNRGR